MTGPATGTGFLAEPGAVIAGIVAGAEPALGQDVIAAAIARAAPSRAQQRRLAAALSDDPGLLTSGRPEGPPQVELLIRVLRENGAQQLVLPRCAGCGRPRRLVQRDGMLRICTSCDRRRRRIAEPCAICGSTSQVRARDRDGRPRCGRCRPGDGPDPAGQIAAHVSRLGPGLDQPRLLEVIRDAIPRPFQRHQVLRELDRRPGLLTGDGAHGSPRGQRPHPGAAGRRRGRRGGPCLPVVRTDGAAEQPPGRDALLPALLGPDPARGLQPLPAARPGGQPHRGRRAGLQQMLPRRPGQPRPVRHLRPDRPGHPRGRRQPAMPALLPPAAGHLHPVRPGKALLPGLLRHAPLP